MGKKRVNKALSEWRRAVFSLEEAIKKQKEERVQNEGKEPEEGRDES